MQTDNTHGPATSASQARLGVAALCWRALTVDIPQRAEFQREQWSTTVGYLRTGDTNSFSVSRREYLVLFDGSTTNMDTQTVRRLLDDPDVRRLLPPSGAKAARR